MPKHEGQTIGQREELRVVDCKMCGYAHLEKLPGEKSLATFYESEFWQVTKAGSLEKIEAQRKWWEAVYGDWLTLLGLYTPGVTLLDVGCGYGHFLQAAQRDHWDVDGIEPNAEAAQAARKMTGLDDGRIYSGTWVDFPKIHPDVVSAILLIEHLLAPLEFLEWCHVQLNNDGLLLVVVPNDLSQIQQAVNGKVGKPYWWIEKTHINYFTPVTLSNLLGRAGFAVLKTTTLFPMENFLRDGQDYTVSEHLGTQLHKKVEVFDLKMTPERRRAYYAGLARHGLGREIVMIARRK
jgi:2-polyprenyl-3-methyl-5-hydroxy-6-metoxy-1,4-benzoquinol methylase